MEIYKSTLDSYCLLKERLKWEEVWRELREQRLLDRTWRGFKYGTSR